MANSCGLSISSPNINADAVAVAGLHQKSTVASRISPQRAPAQGDDGQMNGWRCLLECVAVEDALYRRTARRLKRC